LGRADDWLTVSLSATADSEPVLLDARSYDEYRGLKKTPGAFNSGCLRGSVSLYAFELCDPVSGEALPLGQVADIARDYRLTDADVIIIGDGRGLECLAWRLLTLSGVSRARVALGGFPAFSANPGALEIKN
jgi:3-mercaptopyruvate sulfurtransferase SseA